MKPIIISGEYATAYIYAKTIEDGLIEQCTELLNQEMVQGSKIRIMPDTHIGAGCMIGTTMTVNDYICPNLVGVDIGCGMLTVNIGKNEIDFEKFDNIITEKVPLGFNTHSEPNTEAKFFFENDNNQVKTKINMNRVLLSVGTLGGGNHFIEIDKDEETQEQYLIIHTGSRNFGLQIADYWQDKAVDLQLKNNFINIKLLIEKLKAEQRVNEIEVEITRAKKHNKKVLKHTPNKDLAYLEGYDKECYLHDMSIAQAYATLNRKTIANTILNSYFNKDLDDFEHFETIHNYIDFKSGILRKGAVSAQKNEVLLIPLNMRDGSLIAKGKGNDEWNYSAPHGAGRLMSRTKAKKQVNLKDFEASMQGIFSTSVNNDTLDESPFAYKDHAEIIDAVQDTVEIITHIKPVYNRKAGN